jgi:hypothetical protein
VALFAISASSRERIRTALGLPICQCSGVAVDGASLAGEYGWWARAEQLRRAAEQRGLWLERVGYKGDLTYWVLIDATTSRVVAGHDSGRPEMRLADRGVSGEAGGVKHTNLAT